MFIVEILQEPTEMCPTPCWLSSIAIQKTNKQTNEKKILYFISSIFKVAEKEGGRHRCSVALRKKVAGEDKI